MTDDQVFSDLGEDALVVGVIARYAAMPPFVQVGPGDDAAVLDLGGPVVASTDTLVQGRDFLLEWSSAHDIGVKTAAQNFADIAAMGARPVALLVSLSAPGDVPAAFARDLATGLDDECRRAGAAVVGGDVSGADEIVITGTALGVLDGVAAVLRSGARVGDVVALAGRTGPSAAGLALLQAVGPDRPDRPDRPGDADHGALLAAHRAPRPDYAAGPVAARAGATAMIDTSDGLLRDAGRIGSSSAVTLDLDPAMLVPGADLLAAAQSLGGRELGAEWVLTGGEDHALLACFPAGAVIPAPFTVIGVCRERQGHAVLVGGQPWTGPTGWTHWS